MKSYKYLFSRALAASPGRLHFAAHSHHLWPDASYEGHLAAWDEAATLADRKWDKIFGEVMPKAQASIAAELNLPDPRTIAFATNTLELLARAFWARSVPFDILTTDGEFHSFRRQSARWVEAGLANIRVVPCEPFATFTERFVAAMREKPPQFAFLSHVMFRSGLRFDGVEEIAEHASPDGAWVILDVYHSFMAIPCDLSKVADRVFILGGGYKYAMAGEGLGFMHAPPKFAPRPVCTGWFADFGTIEAKQGEVGFGADGSRFLGATLDPTALYRFNAVREMLARVNVSTADIAARVAALRPLLERGIENGDAGVLGEAELLHPNESGPQPRFISLRHPKATQWKAHLMAHNVITDARDDILRIGLGLYHDEPDIPAFCAAAKKALG
jgi:selenocysteine lyase/cysteine desulfurase